MMELFTIFMVLCMACLGSGRRLNQVNSIYNSISVMDYGAVGDGQTDDSRAFLKAWEVVCKGASDIPDLIVPMEYSFLLKPVKFEGPCQEPFNIQILGTILAPSKLSEWDRYDSRNWIVFSNVSGLTISGNGVIDGQGSAWWKEFDKAKGLSEEKLQRPTALSFYYCDNLQLCGLQHINSPRNHIYINSCTGVTLSNLNITAPETSPNTDGINIGFTTNVQIHDCNIGTGDDCIAIGGGTSNVNITRVSCGPGHGISIGSLGANKKTDEVEQIHARNCDFVGTTNGARIKTWQGGSGFARFISFEEITLTDVANPIIIDQYYCGNYDDCKNQTSAVQVSHVSYSGVHGTSATDEAIKLSCSETMGCTDISLSDINIQSASQGETTRASCINAHGSASSDTIPVVECLSRHRSGPYLPTLTYSNWLPNASISTKSAFPWMPLLLLGLLTMIFFSKPIDII